MHPSPRGSLNGVRPNVSAKSYLYASVRNAALDRLKHRAVVRRVHRRMTDEEMVPGIGQAAPVSDERLERSDLQATLQRAFEI